MELDGSISCICREVRELVTEVKTRHFGVLLELQLVSEPADGKVQTIGSLPRRREVTVRAQGEPKLMLH